MSPITPIADYSSLAHSMVKSVITDSPAKQTHIKNFYETANKTGTQSNALISYFSELSRVADTPKETYKKFWGIDDLDKISERIWNFDKLMLDEANKTTDLKKELNKFFINFTEQYPKTAQIRLATLEQGAVVDDKIKPTSTFSKFMIFIRKFIAEE